MRYISLFLITLFLASCGNQKIRFSRVNSTKQKVVEINDIPKLKIKTETAYTPETGKESPEVENATARAADSESDKSTEESLNLPEDVSNSFPKSVQDSTTVSDEEARAIQNEALRAERLGNWSFALSLLYFLFVLIAIIALVFTFSSNYSPVAIITSLIFGLIALASLITSVILGAASLKAAYNTPKGRKRALIGVIISSVFLGLILVNLAFSLF